MTQQDDITQRVLTDDEINDLCGWRASNTTMRAENDRALAREVESALLSKLRAPVADTLPLEAALHVLVDKIVPGLDTGDLVHDAGRASAVLGAIMASAPVANERERSAHNAAIKAAARVCADIARQYDPQNNQENALASELYSAAAAILKLAEASSPVAGEVVAWMRKDGGDCWTAANKRAVSAGGIPEKLLADQYSIPLAYAAPQASAEQMQAALQKSFDMGKFYGSLPETDAEDVRNAALEEAAQVAYEALHPTNPRSDWTECAEHSAQHAAWAAQSIRALKQPQADKDGGQQRNWVSDWSAAIKSLPMGRIEGVVDKSPNLQGSSVDRSTDLQGRGDDVVLPPLPSPPVHRGHALFAGSQMQTYARAAVLADRQQRDGDDLIHALGECRDAFPTPDIAGSRLDLLWQEAMSDPTAVPAYVKACAARAALSAPQAEQGERDE